MNQSPLIPYFRTPERLALLQEAALAWKDTPYVTSGAVRGKGASCHRLAGAILADAGFPLPAVPERGMTRKCEYFDAMVAYMLENCQRFAPVALKREALMPGDVLLCKVGIGHTALFLGGVSMDAMQVLRNASAHRVSLRNASEWSFVRSAWRPVEIAPIVDGNDQPQQT